MRIFQERLRRFLLSEGVADVGFSKMDGGIDGLNYAISIVVKLSDAIVDSIQTEPTHQYFHHYRTVNTFIDQTLLKAGFFLEREGYRFIPVAASQSINRNANTFSGLFSHKQAAVAAGLGTVGKNALFLHHKYGARVRLGTLFTDCPFSVKPVTEVPQCYNCDKCVKACPSGAITGAPWQVGTERREVLDAKACSDYMKHQFQHIGRGAVCGICMRVCPYRNEGACQSKL